MTLDSLAELLNSQAGQQWLALSPSDDPEYAVADVHGHLLVGPIGDDATAALASLFYQLARHVELATRQGDC